MQSFLTSVFVPTYGLLLVGLSDHTGMKVLVTGASGLLGRAVMQTCVRAGHHVVGLAFSRASDAIQQLDLTDADAVYHVVRREHPEVVINLAAERRPDVVEQNPDAVKKLNVEAPAVLAKACRELDPPAYLIHISTDYVFDGRNPPYAVTDATNPLNAYGRSKRDGESAVLASALPGHATNLRLPVLYGETLFPGESAVNVLLEAIQPRGSRVRMDAHSVRYPTNVTDVARVIEQLATLYQKRLHSSSSPMPSALHFSAQESMTKYDMCLTFSRLWNDVCGEAVSSTDHLDPQYEEDPRAATQRPGNCHLDVQATADLGIDVHCVLFEEWWRDYLARCGPPTSSSKSTESQSQLESKPDINNSSPSASVSDSARTKPTRQDMGHNQGTKNVSNSEDSSLGAMGDKALPAPAVADHNSHNEDDDLERYGTRTPSEQLQTSDHTNETQCDPPVEFTVRVGDPQRVGDPVTAHVVYTVRLTTNAPWFARPELSVLRRYSDFRWLHAAMVHNHPGVVVPPIPEKVKLGRFAPELVEFRRRSLERALHKILLHPMLQRDDDLKLFLESSNLSADIHDRDARKGRVITPEYKTYFGWSQALQQYRFEDPDDWFSRQLDYLGQFEVRMKEMAEGISVLSQKRMALAAAQEQLYQSLVALSSSNLSRSVSTCFAALGDMKKRSAQTSTALADHEANVLGLVVYEYERMVGSIRKAFATREEVWQAWQHADDELSRVRSKYARPNDAHIDAQNHALTHAQIAHAALHTRFEEVTRLCKLEVEKLERDKVADLRKAFEDYVHEFRRVQHDVMDEWAHCESIVLRVTNKSNKVRTNMRARGEEQEYGLVYFDGM